MSENLIDNFINNLLQDRDLQGNSRNWANWMSELLPTSCKYCVEQHGKIVDISVVVILGDAIGDGEAKNMSSIAKLIGVTVGTLTIAMNNLVKKGYVVRTRSEEDRRVVLISLAEKGKKAYVRHQEFHLEMIKAMREGLSDEQCLVLLQAIRNLKDHLKTV